MKKRCKKAFTLAEVLITLTILGVVAAIVIPTMMRNNGEAANRTKMKKAIANYEQAIENMRIANDLKTAEDITSWATCSNVKEFFKIKKDLGECKFLTSDNLYWDVKSSDKYLKETIVSLTEDCIDSSKQSTDACKTDKFFKLTFENSSDGRSITYNKVDGDACAALKFAKILNESTSCTSPLAQKFAVIEQNCTDEGYTWDSSSKMCKGVNDDSETVAFGYNENGDRIAVYVSHSIVQFEIGNSIITINQGEATCSQDCDNLPSDWNEPNKEYCFTATDCRAVKDWNYGVYD